ncbi:hypothetical protein [Mycobacteroides abscessus]|uniref:hypothetical protein n=1 Tax=Mycobacteroides abscessus TaxID=36809 RepID=UPI0005E8C529|nr:hypothetical protein [Mycobacteroides abscessus]MBE5510514.1 hypothetical protein [Mycobacteroides abscessus]MBN7322834.1 hypothetical protein [Mycobacteroides abscessus subsp. massiliense]MBN7388184.1 hypothetical protein [Mycobacteroides abscessus subsp. abscessus]MBN7417671.1 hypothetical protein [Mycobacteroides abscessus subsp. abscessus]MBN7488740.1 hypothetical protein [Mycobacteroides abscessus subsp. abscessus]
MSNVLTAMVVLACPLGMAAMMWMMMRGSGDADSSGAGELQALRVELEQLKSERPHTM